MTKRYTDAALTFIAEKKNSPFFLYVAHTFPHVPLFASAAFKGTSQAGIYGDAVQELDWSVGQILKSLKQSGIAERTFVFFSSDNGPWLIMGNQGGSAGPLRDGKGSTWEGGMRVPGIAWWPTRIKPGVTSAPASTMDLFTTALGFGHAPLPAGVTIDGRDLSRLLFEQQPTSEAPFFYYRGDKLAACRIGHWKAHLFTQTGYGQAKAELHEPPLLFHLGHDPSEKRNVAANHPDIVARIQAAIQAHSAGVTPAPPQLQ